MISCGEALPFGLVIDPSCGGISTTMGVTDLFDLDFVLYRCQCGCDLTAGWGYVSLRLSLLVSILFSLLTFSLSFSSSSSWPLWQDMTRPAHAHSINQELRLRRCTSKESAALPFFAVSRETASSHFTKAKSLNTCLCAAFSDTRRHKVTYRIQRCLSPWQHQRAR